MRDYEDGDMPDNKIRMPCPTFQSQRKRSQKPKNSSFDINLPDIQRTDIIWRIWQDLRNTNH